MGKFKIIVTMFITISIIVWYVINEHIILVGYYGDNRIIDNNYYIPNNPESRLYREKDGNVVNRSDDYNYRFSNLQKIDKRLSDLRSEKVQDNYGEYESLNKLILLRSESTIFSSRDQNETMTIMANEIKRTEGIYGSYIKNGTTKDGGSYYLWNKDFSSLILKTTKDNEGMYNVKYLLLDNRLDYFNPQMSPENSMSVCENTEGCKNFYGKSFLIKQ